MFDTFQSRLTVAGYLVAESPLRVGAGHATELVDAELPVIRDQHDRPFIPGSSLKGALRSHLEALVRGKVPPDADLKHLACDPTGDECLNAEQMRRLKNKYRDDDAGLAEAVTGKSCLLCQTFGSPWFASPVRVRDLPIVANEWFGQFDVRDGVAIDRDKGTVAVGPYDYEVVPAGTRFELYITAENLADWQRGLLWLGLRALERGDVALGGFTGRGLGWVRLEGCHVRLVEGAQALIDLLGGVGAGEEVNDEKAKPWVDELLFKLGRKGERQNA
ncbi:MAG: CRISPR-associated RAMP protein Csx7 [Anaerolineae bacterium]